MNIINVKVNFKNGTCETTGINLITGDYNSTKLVFTFDREDGTKVFEMKSPSEQLVMVQQIIGNEIELYGLKDVTTTHNSKTYTEYTKENAIYWYNEDDNKLFDSTWTEVATFDLSEYELVQEKASIFTEEGKYIFEVSLYESESKLTSAKGQIKVKPEQVVIDGEVVEAYLPIFDQLLSQVNTAITQTDNLNITGSKTDSTTTITITKKDGTTQTLQVLDGQKGDKGDKGDAGAIKMIIVNELPSAGQDDTIYLVPITGETGNNYDEYVYVNNQWEKLGGIQVEVDLTDYVKNTDYATSSKGGVIKTGYGLRVTELGYSQAIPLSYANYENAGETLFISKGTLENVITGKGLTTKTYVDELVGDINTAIDSINGEVI